ncbi:hypothetical protein [Terriglobus aquaticus]|uniref:Uncharacterized protein n=1 Tax=Terriglobus aquaticus TaxID=940139 RepID=A0ABW9KKX3_9BACT|nr:hypothetical protein [Terriglobus aquaticus]
MGLLHDFNLKRKVVGVLVDRRGMPQSAAAIAGDAGADEREVERLLDAMVQAQYAASSRVRGLEVFALNEAQESVGKVLHTFEDKNEAFEPGMTLREDRHGWTAELMDPAGLLVHGRSREEAMVRGRAMMERMSQLPNAAIPEGTA